MIVAIGTARNIPIIPKYAPPTITENITKRGLIFNVLLIILGSITLASNCWKMSKKINTVIA